MRRPKDSRMPAAVQPEQWLGYPCRVYKKQESLPQSGRLLNYVAILLTGFNPSPPINECFINLGQQLPKDGSPFKGGSPWSKETFRSKRIADCRFPTTRSY